MGHIIEQIALKRGHQIAAIVDPVGGRDDSLAGADVAIEFSTPATAETNIRKAWAAGVPVVSGTTGWDSVSLLEEDKRLHAQPMLVWSSNYSIGVNLFFELNKDLAQMMAAQPQYTPSITEIHHIHKLDKPSGTAKTLAEAISYQRSDVNLPIESIREGEVPGTHTVTWDSPEDTIIITHIAKGREGFALGAVIAAEKLYERKN